MSRPPLHEKRPCSNRLWKNKKCGKNRKKIAHHDRTIQSHQHDKPSAMQFLAPSTKERPGTDSARARLAQQLRKIHRKCHKTDTHTVLTTVQNLQKTHKKHGKIDNLMSQNWPTEGPMFQKSFSKEGFRVHLIRTLSFSLGKSDSKKKWRVLKNEIFWSAKAREGPT